MCGHNLFSAPSEPEFHTEPSMLKTENVSSPQKTNVKPEMYIGDYVCIHSRIIRGFHMCCIVGEFAGRYQLYCTEGVWNTSFSGTELFPVTSCSPIPLDEWRRAPKVSLRSIASNSTLHEHCNCSLPETSQSIVISSASEDENEAPDMWVNNGAYTLNGCDKEVVLSRRRWLTDKIISAAQMILLQFFPKMAGLQTPTLQKVFGFHAYSGDFVQIIHVRNNH